MYIVEGNIGAGKSTFLKLIKKHLPHIGVTLEPLDNWQQKLTGQSLLANFYQEPKRWAYTLETLTMMSRVKDHLHEQTKPDPRTVIERSIYSGHYCFARNSFETGFLTETEWLIYCQWFNFLVPNRCKTPHGIIYLHVEPETAYERVRKRNRYAEKKMTLKYLKQIHQRHEDFLLHKKNILPELKTVPVLVLNCNAEFETDLKQLKEHLDKVEQFLINPHDMRLEQANKEMFQSL